LRFTIASVYSSPLVWKIVWENISWPDIRACWPIVLALYDSVLPATLSLMKAYETKYKSLWSFVERPKTNDQW